MHKPVIKNPVIEVLAAEEASARAAMTDVEAQRTAEERGIQEDQAKLEAYQANFEAGVKARHRRIAELTDQRAAWQAEIAIITGSLETANEIAHRQKAPQVLVVATPAWETKSAQPAPAKPVPAKPAAPTPGARPTLKVRTPQAAPAILTPPADPEPEPVVRIAPSEQGATFANLVFRATATLLGLDPQPDRTWKKFNWVDNFNRKRKRGVYRLDPQRLNFDIASLAWRLQIGTQQAMYVLTLLERLPQPCCLVRYQLIRTRRAMVRHDRACRLQALSIEALLQIAEEMGELFQNCAWEKVKENSNFALVRTMAQNIFAKEINVTALPGTALAAHCIIVDRMEIPPQRAVRRRPATQAAALPQTNPPVFIDRTL